MTRLLTLIAFAAFAVAAPAADKPRQLTPEQRARLKALVASQGGKLTPQQRAQLRERLLQPAAKPTKPTAPVVNLPKAPSPGTPVADLDVAHGIDAAIDARLSDEKIATSPAATDAEFVRRATLDLTGVTPTADEARAFLADTSSDKRAKLVDRLLASPRFGTHLADIWVAKLIPRDSGNRFVNPEAFQDWLATEFNANRPWDEFVTKLLTATGSPEDNPAATLFLSNRSADKLTDLVGKQLMGVQIGCAQCHNHPFTDWKQDDYWGMAAFFSKVMPKPPTPPAAVRNGREASPGGVTELPTKTRIKDFFPESAKDLPPKLPGSVAPTLDPKGPYRPTLAKWLTSGSTPYFSEAFVNRAWAQLYGRGLVDPVDDLDPEHPASHPELFKDLATQFRATGFDIKRLYRALALSETYGRSSVTVEGNESDKTLWSHMPVKVLSPEQLFDSIAQVVPEVAGKPEKTKAATPYRRPKARDQFVQFFLAGADAPNAKEYEAGIPQALRLMNSRILSNPKAAAPFIDFTLDRTCDNLYLATVSRLPTADERVKLRAYHQSAGGDARATADILWALLNCSEFALNR